jgi:DNA-binding GntR family transcriptional regulator
MRIYQAGEPETRTSGVYIGLSQKRNFKASVFGTRVEHVSDHGSEIGLVDSGLEDDNIECSRLKFPLKASNVSVQTRKFLKDVAYDQLKQEILSGTLAPDAFWSERALSERLRLGKAPVRDAVNRLRQENYLVVVPQQGIVVKQVSDKDAADTFEARLIVEPQIAARLAGKLSKHDRESLEDNLEQQQRCVDNDDSREFVKLDVEFHLGLVRAHGNADLVRMMEPSCERTFRAISRAFDGRTGHLAQALRAHKSILSGIVKGDPVLASERMRKHISETWQRRGLKP